MAAGHREREGLEDVRKSTRSRGDPKEPVGPTQMDNVGPEELRR